MFSATLFDYNGVLVDDEAVHLAAFRDALSSLGVEVSQARYFEEYIGYDDAAAFVAILRDKGRSAPPELVSELVRAKGPMYLARARADLPVFEGAAALVARSAARGPVGVVSGALRDEIELGLRVLGVSAHVGYVVSAEDAPRSKPDPQGYLLALDWLSSLSAADAASDVVVIEDSLAGVEAAKRAGLRCIAVAHSYPKQRLESSRADVVVERLTDIDDALLERLHASLDA
ncbi:MAG TPA: HAD family phosphatase [Polyangiaceae bacterium]|jgi:HAD superfamily hydrolase (TIGR01509 family)